MGKLTLAAVLLLAVAPVRADVTTVLADRLEQLSENPEPYECWHLTWILAQLPCVLDQLADEQGWDGATLGQWLADLTDVGAHSALALWFGPQWFDAAFVRRRLQIAREALEEGRCSSS